MMTGMMMVMMMINRSTMMAINRIAMMTKIARTTCFSAKENTAVQSKVY